MKCRQTDVVYFLMQGLHLPVGLPVARLLRKPAVVKISGSIVIPLMTESFLGRLELRWMRYWAARVMVLNDGMMESAVSEGFDGGKVMLMPNPVDTAEFRPAQPGEAARWRDANNIPADAVVVIYVGRLSREKGLPELLGGFAFAARVTPGLRLVLLGDGP